MVGMADGFAQASGPDHGRQPPHGARGRQRDGGDLQRPGQPLAAADHRRPAGAGADHPAGEPDQPRRDPDAAPAGQVVLRAAAGRGRAAGPGARRPPRLAAAEGPGLRLAADGRLVRRGRRGRRPPRDRADGDRPRRRRPRGGAGPRRAARRRHQPGPRRRPRHRRQRRLGHGDRARRAPAPAGLGLARHRRRPARLPRGPPQLPRRPAAGDRPGRPDARGPRPDPRRRQLGLPLLPLHPRPAAARGREAGRDHQRSRRGRPRADGRRDRRRREADPGGAAGGGPRVEPPGAGAEPAAAGNPGDRPAQLLDRPLRPGRGPPRGRDRRPRVALQHPRPAQPAAPLAPRQLLLQRRRRARLRPRRLGRRPARPARPPGRLRARRGLGAVRDHRLLERRRLQDAGHLPRPAQRGVRDPQVVRRSRAGDGSAGPRPAPSSTSPRSPRATASRPTAPRGATRSATRSPAALASSQPELVEVPVAPGMALF